MKSRLFVKHFLILMIIGLSAIAVSWVLIESRIKAELGVWIEKDLTAQARIIAMGSEAEMKGRTADLSRETRARVTIVNVRGRVVADSGVIEQMDNHLNRPEIQEARLKGRGSSIRYSRTLKTDMLYIAVPYHEGRTVKGYVRLARPLAEIAETIDRFRYTVTHILLLVVMCFMIAALFFSMKVISPIRDMAEFTEKIGKGDMSGTLMIDSRDEIGQLAANINTMVTALQERIRAANEEKEKLVSAFASMEEGVIVIGGDNRIEALNRGMKEIIGARYGDIVGKTVIEAFRSVELHNALEKFRQDRQPALQEIALGDDNEIVLDVNISPVKPPPGEPPKTMMVFHNVTRLKKLERVRSDFVANVTHEIRTPLTAIIGFVETLQQGDGPDGETAKRFLQVIHDNAKRLSRLVDDLMTLSGIELGETKLQIAPLDMNDTLDNALAVFQAKALEKRIGITKNIPAEIPMLKADRDRVSQVFLNVLDNAVKFTPEGGRITIDAVPEGDGWVKVSISDTGPGIPKKDIPRLGERFYRVDKSRSREVGGTGLGLSIVKHLMFSHGGRMEIESTQGAGTTVLLYFPASATG